MHFINPNFKHGKLGVQITVREQLEENKILLPDISNCGYVKPESKYEI